MMNILQVSKLMGISKSAIRFYEEKGLINPGRSSNGYRDYTEEHLREIKWINILRKADFSVSDIKLITDLKKMEQSEICKEDTLQFISQQICSIDEKLDFLSAINSGLREIHRKIQVGDVQSNQELLSIISQVEVQE